MFTGIVTDVGEVLAIDPAATDLRRIRIACGFSVEALIEGASISCAGICLTVVGAGVEHGRNWFEADAAAETLSVTTAGQWRVGSRVNLERSLRLGDELGGHLVSGHIDGVAEVVSRDDLPDSARFRLSVPAALARFIASKGSVALDGVSLTINDVAGNEFSVMIIPHTLKVTTFGELAKGDRVNLEVDSMARYAARLAEAR